MAKLSDADLRKTGDELEAVRKMIDELEKVGLPVPPALRRALDALQVVINGEDDFGQAFQDASRALASLERDLYAACNALPDDQQDVCAARVASLYQARAVNFTLGVKNPNSVISNFIRNTMKRYTLGLICQHWDYCRRQVKANEQPATQPQNFRP